MKEIRLSGHAKQKIEILKNHEISLDLNFIIETARSPDFLETAEANKFIAQKCLDQNLVLRVVYREFTAFILIITLYPGKRFRYEKN